MKVVTWVVLTVNNYFTDLRNTTHMFDLSLNDWISIFEESTNQVINDFTICYFNYLNYLNYLNRVSFHSFDH